MNALVSLAGLLRHDYIAQSRHEAGLHRSRAGAGVQFDGGTAGEESFWYDATNQVLRLDYPGNCLLRQLED